MFQLSPLVTFIQLIIKDKSRTFLKTNDSIHIWCTKKNRILRENAFWTTHNLFLWAVYPEHNFSIQGIVLKLYIIIEDIKWKCNV